MRRLWLIEFVGNALLIALFYWWLGIRDSRASQIALSFAVGAVLIAGAVWLHSLTFHKKPLRFAALALIFLLACWGLSSIPVAKAALWAASTLTFRSRKPVNPDTVRSVLSGIVWFIQWIVVPIVLLRKYKSPIFWLQYIAVVLIAFVIPGRLIDWTPKLTSTAAQFTSFTLRFAFAYCLAITGFVAFSRFTSAGSPVESQPSTVPLP
jgi:hypothetical protein